MPRRLFPIIGVFVMVVALVVTAFPTASNVRADVVLGNLPSLQGYNIYFSDVGTAASRFDRSDAGISRLAGLLELVGANMYTLEWRTGVPADADLVVIPGPMKDLTGDQLAWLWAYLQGGGKLLLLTDPVVKPFEGFKAAAGLFQLMWDDMGLRARDDVVVLQGAPIMAMAPVTAVKEGTPTPTPAPPVEIASLIAAFLATDISTQHPITAGLEGDVHFSGARSLQIDETPRQARVWGLIYSDPTSYGETGFQLYVDTGYAVYDQGVDTTPGALVLAAAMEDSVAGTRIVLIGDRDFATNGGGLQTSPPYSPSFLYPGNVRFLMNAIAWLLGAESVTAELSFPTPGPTVTPTLTPTPTATPQPTAEGASS